MLLQLFLDCDQDLSKASYQDSGHSEGLGHLSEISHISYLNNFTSELDKILLSNRNDINANFTVNS